MLLARITLSLHRIFALDLLKLFNFGFCLRVCRANFYTRRLVSLCKCAKLRYASSFSSEAEADGSNL